MWLNKQLNEVKIVCINTYQRKDRKKRMMLQAKRLGLPLKYHITKLNKDPKKGCLESHLHVIREAFQEKKYEYLMILEDDAKFIRPLLPFPEPPKDWDMLYLGGTVHSRQEDYDENWVKVITWTAHAYLINLKNKTLIEQILEAKNSF